MFNVLRRFGTDRDYVVPVIRPIAAAGGKKEITRVDKRKDDGRNEESTTSNTKLRFRTSKHFRVPREPSGTFKMTTAKKIELRVNSMGVFYFDLL